MRSALLRAVLDTNVLVSALLFNQGRLSWLRPCWQQVQLTPVLAYPKFRLQAAERERLLEDLLPWCESWTAAIPTSAHRVRDPHEQVFLDLALAAATPALVTGDADLLAPQETVPTLQILAPADFQSWLSSST